eukprot:UN03726
MNFVHSIINLLNHADLNQDYNISPYFLNIIKNNPEGIEDTEFYMAYQNLINNNNYIDEKLRRDYRSLLDYDKIKRINQMVKQYYQY